MKKLILLTLFMICFTGLLHAKSNDIVINQNGEVIGRMSPLQFELLVTASDNYKELMLAQQERRVTITCDEVKKTSKQGQYTANLRISWKDKKGKELNYITSSLTLNIDNDSGMNKYRVWYRDIAEIGFPISSGLFLLIIVLL